ncbi:MAG: signal peptidase I [Dehalococcoidales bacterium]|nr:signal peptidase I [Dehalococcoidales bacterium]
MKRGIGLALVIASVLVGIYSVREWMPITAILGTSMEPTLKRGDIVLIERASPTQVKVGDVIIFKVHPLIQENYHYPSTIAHRVTEVTTFLDGIAFKTKGDNTAADPFVVPSSDLRGKVNVNSRIPYVGHMLLFLQSRQGMIFAIIALFLLGVELYANDFSRGKRRVLSGIFAPVLEGNKKLAESQQQAIQTSSKALEQFASAMSEYAQHLASHTSAIQGLSQASHELSKSAAQQNQVLAHLMQITQEPKPVTGETLPNIGKTVREPGHVTPKSMPKSSPPGCYRSHRETDGGPNKPNLN